MKLFAPAKVNLALHVTGRREDGYHLLDSLVVFAGVGDWLDIAPAPELRLSLSGPRARGVPAGRGNLVWRAAKSFATEKGAAILLEKNLPHAGGIGGGSADAGAAMRGLSALWNLPVPAMAEQLAIGADLPVCVRSLPARMRGIGELLDPVPPLPHLWLVLVNPGVEVPTGPVFEALETVENAPMPQPEWHDRESLLSWMSTTRNDLEPAALALQPALANVLDALRSEPACSLARMSGSGGTCFGIFASETQARDAALTLAGRNPDWWVAPAPLLRGGPQFSRATT